MSSKHQTLRAAAFGNLMEWFDFTLYGFFAMAIGHNFFPSGDPLLSMLASFSAFAVGFLVRPLGAWVLGRAADRHGRKPVLLWTFSLMGLSTLLVVAAPPHWQSGWLGPVMVVLARLLAGFAAAGETGAAAALAIEAAPAGQRGRWGAWFSLSTYLGLAAGSAVALLCYGLLGVEATNDWGWRLGYGVGLLILPLGWWSRSQLEEPSPRVERPNSSTGAHTLAMALRVAGLTAFGSAVVYVVIVFMPVYAAKHLGLDLGHSTLTSTVASLLTGLAALAGGSLSDRWGRKRVMYCGLVLAAAPAWPLFSTLLAAPDLGALLAFQLASAAGLGVFVGGSLPLMVESFSPTQRALGVGMGYNLGVMVFGAMGPVVNTFALSRGYPWAPLLYLAGAALVTAATLKGMPETRKAVRTLQTAATGAAG